MLAALSSLIGSKERVQPIYSPFRIEVQKKTKPDFPGSDSCVLDTGGGRTQLHLGRCASHIFFVSGFVVWIQLAYIIFEWTP